MDQVVDGLKILISGEELRQHLAEKAGMHQEKADLYRGQIGSIEAIGDDLSNQSMDPRRQLLDKERSHRQRAQLFDFMATHIVVTASYMLNEQDLMRVEIMDRSW